MEELRVYTSREALYALGHMRTVGENIKALRVAKGFKTQGDFAEALKVPQPRLSDWENNRYGLPEVPNLIKIAKVLKVSIDELLGGIDIEYDAVLNDLTRPTAGVRTLRGGLDGQAQTRIRELEARNEKLEMYAHVIKRVRPMLADAITALGDEGDQAAATKTPRRRRH